MRRIVVSGSTGSGKTTFAGELARLEAEIFVDVGHEYGTNTGRRRRPTHESSTSRRLGQYSTARTRIAC